MATRTERGYSRPREREEQGTEGAEREDEQLPSDGGLVRLEVPGSEATEE
jgi:hypothetical protein